MLLSTDYLVMVMPFGSSFKSLLNCPQTRQGHPDNVKRMYDLEKWLITVLCFHNNQ